MVGPVLVTVDEEWAEMAEMRNKKVVRSIKGHKHVLHKLQKDQPG